MNDEPSDLTIPAEKRERLVMLLHPRRIALLFHYVFGSFIIFIGLAFNLAASAEVIHPGFGSWFVGFFSLILGALFIVHAEYMVKSNLYVVTTWNVRIRTGIIHKSTQRIFYDDIDKMETKREPGESVAQMGDVCIFKKGISDEPYLTLRDIRHPDGFIEIIKRFISSISNPTDWAHIEK
jgi:membrane protein YdbS with pleckstrin-like domain